MAEDGDGEAEGRHNAARDKPAGTAIGTNRSSSQAHRRVRGKSHPIVGCAGFRS